MKTSSAVRTAVVMRRLNSSRCQGNELQLRVRRSLIFVHLFCIRKSRVHIIWLCVVAMRGGMTMRPPTTSRRPPAHSLASWTKATELSRGASTTTTTARHLCRCPTASRYKSPSKIARIFLAVTAAFLPRDLETAHAVGCRHRVRSVARSHAICCMRLRTHNAAVRQLWTVFTRMLPRTTQNNFNSELSLLSELNDRHSLSYICILLEIDDLI